MRAQLRTAFVVAMFVVSSACASVQQAPPNLSPQAQTAFRNSQVLKVLDLIRDTAIDANAQTPPLVSTATTKLIVQYHESTIKMMNASVSGWAATAYQGLVELTKNVPAIEKATIGNYLTLGIATLKGLL